MDDLFPMYIESVPNRTSPPAILLREGKRVGKKVVKRTLANLTHWPNHVVEGLKTLLKGGVALGKDDPRLSITRTLAHGHVAAVLGTIKNIGLDKMIDPRHTRNRDVTIGMIASRILSPSSKLAATREWDDETASMTLGNELGISDAGEQDAYAAMDWLLKRQPAIEQQLAGKHLSDGCLVLCDVSASYYTGSHCQLAKFGHKKDRKLGVPEIVYGLICDHQGCPVAIEVFEGNTSDPAVFSKQMAKVKERFGLDRVIIVGDRGLITQARITEDLAHVEGLDWISALRSSAIQQLVVSGAFQPSLFDRMDMAEITASNFPGERLIVCRNPLLATERARKRMELLAATEMLLQEVVDATRRDKRAFKGKTRIALRVGKIVGKYKMKKHFILDIEEDAFSFERNEASIAKEAALDGFYVVRTSVSAERMDARETVRAYKSLSRVEQAFRSLKSVDLHVRPIYHHLNDRVRAHIFLCMLAYYVEWHMRQRLAPMLFDDEHKEEMAAASLSVVAPAAASPSAKNKAASKRTQDGMAVCSFQTLLDTLSNLCRNTIEFKIPGSESFYRNTEPTPLQTKAFELLDVKI